MEGDVDLAAAPSGREPPEADDAWRRLRDNVKFRACTRGLNLEQ